MVLSAYRITLAIAVVALALVANNASAGGNVLVGKRLFNSYCSICHGEDGKGNGPLAAKLHLKKPVADLTADKYQAMSADQVLDLIQGYNRNVSRMPKWEAVIPERNLRNVAAYILALTQSDIRMRGDARRGREIFRQSCVACHGPRGEGNGVLAQVMNVKMVNYRSSEAKNMTDESLVETITKGKGEFMPPWAGTLSSEEIKDAASYIRTLHKTQ